MSLQFGNTAMFNLAPVRTALERAETGHQKIMDVMDDRSMPVPARLDRMALENILVSRANTTAIHKLTEALDSFQRTRTLL